MNKFIRIFENIILPPGNRWVTAVGVFDGVHPGHREIISTAKQRAEKCGAKVMALTFIPHPRQLLEKDAPPELLVTVENRVKLLLESGADCCGFIDFTTQNNRYFAFISSFY